MKKTYYVVIVVLSCLIAFFSISIFCEEQEMKSTNNQNLNYNFIPEEISEEEKYKKLQEKYNNKDIIATLKIENLFEELVVQTNDNTYYLNHSIDKKESALGSLFIDYRQNIYEDNQINIYGHNSNKYDIAFRKLTNYLEESFYKENNYISLETKEGIDLYEIFSVSITKSDEHVKTFKDEEYYNHLSNLKNNSLYETNVNIEKTDKIIILQTCLFDNPNGSYLVISAKKL